MNDIIFEALKLVLMIAVALITRYVIPCAKRLAETEKMNTVLTWVEQAVLCVQQVHDKTDGAKKKEIVTDFLRGVLDAKHIDMTDEQLDVLIEAAVKMLKMQEDLHVELPAKEGAEAE